MLCNLFVLELRFVACEVEAVCGACCRCQRFKPLRGEFASALRASSEESGQSPQPEGFLVFSLNNPC